MKLKLALAVTAARVAFIAAVAATVGTTDASHNAGSASWDPGYPLTIEACDNNEFVDLRWRVALKGGDDAFENAEDQGLHTFTKASNKPGHDLDGVHWDIPADNITGVTTKPSGTTVIIYRGIYPTSRMIITQGWTHYGSDDDGDTANLLMVNCVDPETQPNIVANWSAVEGIEGPTH